MNPNINSLLLTVTPAVGTVSTTGCASLAVSDEAVVERTAFALGIGRSDFTVSNRVDDGTTTGYSVRTKAGQDFNCLVGGSLGLFGRAVSEAVCSKTGEAARNPLLR